MPEIIVFFISITAVIIGSEWLGNSAAYIAHKLYLPKIVIGATIVSLATTLPEITIALFSGAEGSPELGIGTVFGSPFVNIGLIFGLLLIFSKQEINKSYFSRNIQFLLLAIFLVFVSFIGGGFSIFFSMALIFFGVVYLIMQSLIGTHEEGMLEKIENNINQVKTFFGESNNYQHILYFISGTILLVLGAHFLIGSTTTIASILNIPQLIIGVVVIAIGTSIPEMFTSLDSILKNRTSLSAGNLYGASIINLTIALGIVMMFSKITISQNELFLTVGALSLMASISLLYVFGKLPNKLIGVLLLGVYFSYIVWFTSIELGSSLF